MNHELPKSQVYIKLDKSNRVTRCEGGYSISNIDNIEEWINIDEGYGDKYNLCQSHYFNKPLMNMDGTHNYIYDNNEVRESTLDELAEELAEMPVSEPQPDVQADTQEMMIDHEYRITLLELGITE
ncbi:MAG: hypothetical protein HFE90_03780 [Firmicutes bacterium]|nr:hypothetical protein [Bacillota bacterium]